MAVFTSSQAAYVAMLPKGTYVSSQAAYVAMLPVNVITANLPAIPTMALSPTRYLNLFEEGWVFLRSSSFAPVVQPILSRMMLSPTRYLSMYDDEWMPKPRGTFFILKPNRAVFFTVT